MAITFVGSKTFTHAATSAQSCSLTDLLNEAGATVSPAADDYVFVTYVHAMATLGNRTLAQCTPAGYTAAHAAIIGNASESHSVSMAVSYKKMGGSPDTTVSIPAAAATTNGVSVTIHCFRGVDLTTPLDVTTTTASGINTGVPNAPSITPVTAGAWILVCGSAAVAAGAVFTNPAGLSTTANHFRSATITTTTNDANSGAGLKTDWTSGAFDPAAFGGSTTTNTGSWGAATVALRPTVTPVSATAAPTLGTMTTASPAKVLVKAAAAATIAALTAVGTGTVSDPHIVATAAPSVSAFGSSGAAKVFVEAQGAATPSAFSAQSVAKALVRGSASGALGTFAAQGSTAVTISAASASDIGSFGSTALGTVKVQADAAPALSDFTSLGTVSAASGRTIFGAPAFEALSSAAVAAVRAKAAAALGLGDFASAAQITFVATVPLARRTQADVRYSASSAEAAERTSLAEDAGWTSSAPPRI
jgi:hypothetical protein